MKAIIITGKPQEVLTAIGLLTQTYGLSATINAIIQLTCQKVANQPTTADVLVPFAAKLIDAAHLIGKEKI